MRLMQFAVAATFAACRLHILCLLFLQHLPSCQHSTLPRLVPASHNLPAYISAVAISCNHVPLRVQASVGTALALNGSLPSDADEQTLHHISAKMAVRALATQFSTYTTSYSVVGFLGLSSKKMRDLLERPAVLQTSGLASSYWKHSYLFCVAPR